MIARVWSGAVRREDGDAYAACVLDTELAGYAAAKGNRGAWMLRRDRDARSEFMVFTLWDSLDCLDAVAPEDDRYLVDDGGTVVVYEAAGGAPPPAGWRRGC